MPPGEIEEVDAEVPVVDCGVVHARNREVSQLVHVGHAGYLVVHDPQQTPSLNLAIRHFAGLSLLPGAEHIIVRGCLSGIEIFKVGREQLACACIQV